MAELDIRLDVDFADHPKTKRLIRRLGPEGAICLLRLWAFTALHHPDGALRGMDAEAIADAAGWTGDAQRMLDAMLVGLREGDPESKGFLELGEDGVYRCHDWAEHQPYITDFEARSARGRHAAQVRWRKRLGCGEHAPGMQAARESNAESMPRPSVPPSVQRSSRDDQEGIPPAAPVVGVETVDNPKKPRKVRYAEHVHLTEEEHQKLVDAYGEAMTARMIEILDDYKGAHGKRYKDDYRAIKNWVVQRAQEEKAKGITPPPPRQLRHVFSGGNCNCPQPRGAKVIRNRFGQIVEVRCGKCGNLQDRYE